MRVELAMGFGLTFELPAELDTSFQVPIDLFPFWRAIEPFLCVILTHHPNRDPDEPKELLRATVYVHDISLPTFLQSYLRQLWRDGQPSGEAPDPSDKLAVLAGLRSYVHLTLHNRGREKISALTLTIKDRTSKYVFQLDQQAVPLPQQDGKALLGELQPRQRLVLHIWADRAIGAFTRDLIHLTADNLYKQTWRVPFPQYLHIKFQTWGIISFFVLGLLLVLSPLYIAYLPFLPTCRYP